MVDIAEEIMGAKSICFFNNKGGVGKTTLVANLAAELSINHNLKILLVDADPQCNLSQYLLSDDEYISEYEKEDPETVFSVIHPLSIGKGYKSKLPIRHASNFKCDVIIGDPRLAMKEDLLSQDWRDARAGGTRGLRTTFVFHDLLEKAHDYDFVFFDMGPSLGAINRSILLVSDFFVLPATIDIFSKWAIKNIGLALSTWQKDLANGIKNAEDPQELPIDNNKHVKFLGYVMQQHKERAMGDNVRMVEAYNTISQQFPKIIKENFSKIFAYPDMKASLGEIKHLASLAPKSQSTHHPMISVVAKGSYTTTRKQAREIFSSLARNFLENIKKSEV
ncbi:ParA family protein [Aeromonas salmonicida]|uniref:ParA family protein n=1 Tax=Aeromonas salmonicida TaxID=645 RepID=UPI002240A475|nr:AAA family ATPase [Aeromonas salmonicida]MDR6996545.1 cellulose biosynthesis protein BcsQ [Aeromonas salmonicida]